MWEIFDFAWGDPDTNAPINDDEEEHGPDAPLLAIMDGSVSDGDESGAASPEPAPTTYMSDDEVGAVVPDDSQNIDDSQDIPNDSLPMTYEEVPMDSQENDESGMAEEIPVGSSASEEIAVDTPKSKDIPMDSQEVHDPIWTDLTESQPDPRPPATWDDLTLDSPGSSTECPGRPSSASIGMPPPPPVDPEVIKRKKEIRARMEELRFGVQSTFF